MKESILDRKYIMSKKKLFPEISDGTILYATDENNLYIDFNGERRLVHEYPEWIDLSNKICGVTWDYNNNSTKLTRTGDAAGFADPSPATSVDMTGSSPFDNIYPWRDIKEVNISQDDGTIIEKGDKRFSYSNNTMVWIPEFYYKVEKDEEAHTHSWSISGIQIDGYKKHPGSGKYISRYHVGYDTNNMIYSSITALNPYTVEQSDSFGSFRVHEQSAWRTLDINVWSALQMLYLVEFADWNNQEVLGAGPVDWDRQGEKVATSPSGGTDNALYHTVKTSNSNNQYRFIEDINGNCLDFCDGIALNSNGIVLIGNDYQSYGDLESYTDTGLQIPYYKNIITEYMCDENYDYLFLPKEGISNYSPADPLFDGSYVTDSILFERNPTSDGILVGGSATTYKYDGIFFFGGTYSATSIPTGTRCIYDPTV